MKTDKSHEIFTLAIEGLNTHFYLAYTFLLGTAINGIGEKQWDDFVSLVHKLLEEHPIAQADTVLAIKLGCAVYFHYDAWQGQTINMAQPLLAKVAYLLNYWKQKK